MEREIHLQYSVEYIVKFPSHLWQSDDLGGFIVSYMNIYVDQKYGYRRNEIGAKGR